MKIVNIFLIFAKNIDCRYMLEPSRRSGSNENQQSMFWTQNKKNRYTLVCPVLLGFEGVYFSRKSFPDVNLPLDLVFDAQPHTPHDVTVTMGYTGVDRFINTGINILSHLRSNKSGYYIHKK